jgi:hypothetical protein
MKRLMIRYFGTPSSQQGTSRDVLIGWNQPTTQTSDGLVGNEVLQNPSLTAKRDQAVPTVVSSTQPNTCNPQSPTTSFILFGNHGRRKTLDLYHISARNTSIFQTIRDYARASRGWWRRYLSFWQLSYCDFVKVSLYYTAICPASSNNILLV